MSDDQAQAIRHLVAQWMQDVSADLAVAQKVDEDWLAPKIAAFHAQQAAEKALKALLIQAQSEFPKTHVIALLIQLCKLAGYKDTESLDDVVILTRYAVATRYPGEEESLSHETAQQAVIYAEQVVAWARTHLATDGVEQ